MLIFRLYFENGSGKCRLYKISIVVINPILENYPPPPPSEKRKKRKKEAGRRPAWTFYLTKFSF